MGKETAKRVLDLAVALACLPVAVPVVVAAAVAVRLDSPGGAFFLQQRIGRWGRPFTVYKLRTMVQDASSKGAGLYFEKDDPRFTKVGLVLRRYSLDELPQLWNVIKGDMSIVGPRPTLDFVYERYLDRYREIVAVKPGITGLAQVSGREALTRSQRLRLDTAYATGWSLGTDLRILVKTALVVATGSGQGLEVTERELER